MTLRILASGMLLLCGFVFAQQTLAGSPHALAHHGFAHHGFAHHGFAHHGLAHHGLTHRPAKPSCACCAPKRCQLTVSTETEETECFDVECKDICIPPVTFPWQCRPKKCGRIRTVNVLTTETRERQVCEYKWDVVVICPRCRDALREAGCELAPGMQVLEEAEPTAANGR
ncbi:CbtA family protein [Candidatus Laterigemmans baculatus]|uniref:CbtA family protein n=1 Tax=Candidatus Laterigemmans baculatus TaxID=2770505 RepID=UPI0013D9436E|nr:CbtA family protein [Candidatus Laterigemmans baculatus]